MMNIEIKNAVPIENIEIKKDTHIVIKYDDAIKYLNKGECDALARFLHTIAQGRLDDGKNPNNSYYVCNTDEPYAPAVLNTIMLGEAHKKHLEKGE